MRLEALNSEKFSSVRGTLSGTPSVIIQLVEIFFFKFPVNYIIALCVLDHVLDPLKYLSLTPSNKKGVSMVWFSFKVKLKSKFILVQLGLTYRPVRKLALLQLSTFKQIQ